MEDKTNTPEAYAATIARIDELIHALSQDLYTRALAPGANNPAGLASYGAAIESLANARVALARPWINPPGGVG